MSTATAEKTQPTEVKGITTKDIDNYIKKNLEKRDLEAKLRDIKEQLDQEEQRLTEYFAENGLQNVKTKSGLAYLSRELFANLVKGEDGSHKKAHTALKRAGLKYLVKDQVNSSSLRAYVRELDENGTAIPKGLIPHINIAEVFRIRVRT